jgi:hypothetical protein
MALGISLCVYEVILGNALLKLERGETKDTEAE